LMRRFLAVLAVLCMSSVAMFGCATTKTASDVAAIGVKAKAGDAAAADALVEMLRSRDKAVRDAAYESLTEAGAPAVPRLIAALEDNDPNIREYAAGALGNIGDERAVEPLMDMLRTAHVRRYVAAWALGEVNAAGAVDLLIETMGEPNDALQKESARALIKIGDKSVPALIKALESPVPDRRKYACRALGVIQDHRAEARLIARLKDEDGDVVSAAALALGTAGTKESVTPLIDALNHGNMTTRVNASIALGQLDAKDAVGPLEKIMESDTDPYVREWSARALENITGNRYKYKNENGDMVYPYNLYR